MKQAMPGTSQPRCTSACPIADDNAFTELLSPDKLNCIVFMFVLPSSAKKHEKYYRIKEAIFRFEDEDLNHIANGIASVKEEDRSLLKLFSIAVYKKPSLLIDVVRLFTGL